MPMKLTNMKLDPKAREEKYAETVAVDRPVYPWGLQVRLDEDALEKLGISQLPAVGKSLMLMARVDVTGVTDNEHMSDGKTHRHRSVELQITDLALGADEGEGGGAAKKLYGKE